MRISDWSSDVCSSDLRAGPSAGSGVSDAEDFDLAPPRDAAQTLNLELDGWEGPLDLLLLLARQQKVDLARISILDLVEQYLAFIADARALRLEIAADYLVMAAWLAYLKRSEEHTSELQSLMRISYAVFCLKKKNEYYRT